MYFSLYLLWDPEWNERELSADKVVSTPVISSIERKCLGILLRVFKARPRQDIGDYQALEVNIYAISFELLKKTLNYHW